MCLLEVDTLGLELGEAAPVVDGHPLRARILQDCLDLYRAVVAGHALDLESLSRHQSLNVSYHERMICENEVAALVLPVR